MIVKVKDLANTLGIGYQCLLLALCRAELNKFRIGKRLINFTPEFIKGLYNFFSLRKKSTNLDTFFKYETAQEELKRIYREMTNEKICN